MQVELSPAVCTWNQACSGSRLRGGPALRPVQRWTGLGPRGLRRFSGAGCEVRGLPPGTVVVVVVVAAVLNPRVGVESLDRRPSHRHSASTTPSATLADVESRFIDSSSASTTSSGARAESSLARPPPPSLPSGTQRSWLQRTPPSPARGDRLPVPGPPTWRQPCPDRMTPRSTGPQWTRWPRLPRCSPAGPAE